MHLLNLKFDATRTNGILEDNTNGAPPLASSKRWITAADPAPFPTPPSGQPFSSVFNPSDPQFAWTDKGPDTTLKFKKSENPGHILVRVFSANAPVGTTVRLTVLVGRKNKSSDFSSPFTLASGQACSVFDSAFDAPAADGSWVWDLGLLKTFPSSPNGSNKYEFIVGITVNGPGQLSTFGHDPEMEVEN